VQNGQRPATLGAMSETGTTDKATGSKNKRFKKPLALFLFGVLIGGVVLGGIRFATVRNTHTHYHANFALFINGQRDEFKLPTYYEEVQACGADENNPRNRVHMHNQESYDVHVHDKGATWGHFFANLGYTLGDGMVATSSKVYVDGQDGNKLQFILNGKPEINIANRVVGNEDVLLVAYGTEDSAALQKEYKTIQHDAREHNAKPDPAACSGSQALTWQDRLKAALGLETNNH
jgi:hypothetical protein